MPAAGLAAAILTTTVAAAGDVAPPEPDREALKAHCEQGGSLRVVGVAIGTPNDRVRFRNQGQCVSFVNHGGTLVDRGTK